MSGEGARGLSRSGANESFMMVVKLCMKSDIMPFISRLPESTLQQESARETAGAVLDSAERDEDGGTESAGAAVGTRKSAGSAEKRAK